MNSEALKSEENNEENNIQGLQEDLMSARKELSILYDVSNAMRTTLELNHILYIILTGVTSHAGLGFNRAILFLANKKERILEGKMVIGPESGEDANKIWKSIEAENKDMDDLISVYQSSKQAIESRFNQEIKKLKIPLNMETGGLLASAYFQGKPLNIHSNEISKYASDPLLSVFKTNELVIMPLKAKDKVNGIIIADNLFTRKPITENDLKIFMMLANQAGLAIENSQLYELVVHKSHTDSLTSLWNHGFFQDTLVLEIEKARQNNAHVGIVIIDVDNFKKLNDTWGHQNGDVVLTELAKILKDSSRENDYMCRYGGEEFSIILTQTNREQAYFIAERLRERIAQYNFPKFSSENFLKLTVSVGVAAFPEDAHTKEDLVMKADRAMYTAKFIGKNKTCVPEPENP
ncbi:MAG: diguanylate cyclase [Candidatus Omnitrophota bacterium]